MCCWCRVIDRIGRCVMDRRDPEFSYVVRVVTSGVVMHCNEPSGVYTHYILDL